jgi:predicted RecA/RadA family phage recombinase
MATLVHQGRTIDYTPSVAKTAGTVVEQSQLIGVVVTDIAANALGALAVEGVFDFPKTAGSNTAIAVGDKVYWDDGNTVATETTSGTIYLGKCVAAADDDDTTVRVKMNQ